MHTTAATIAIATGTFLTIILAFLPLCLSREMGKAAQERARARRMAEHKLHARLLRLDL